MKRGETKSTQASPCISFSNLMKVSLPETQMKRIWKAGVDKGLEGKETQADSLALFDA